MFKKLIDGFCRFPIVFLEKELKHDSLSLISVPRNIFIIISESLILILKAFPELFPTESITVNIAVGLFHMNPSPVVAMSAFEPG